MPRLDAGIYADLKKQLSTAKTIIERLNLAPHPEGGWYRETWRGSGTAILFLLESGQRSHWHRIKGTELWLFQAGHPLLLKTAKGQNGEEGVQTTLMGSDILSGQEPQHVVAPWEWQAAEAQAGWSLVSCVVVPPFEFSAFELAPPGWVPHGQDRDS